MIAVAPLSDRIAIDRILQRESIASKIKRDGQYVGFVDHPLVSYHGAYINGALVGVFIAVRFSTWEREVHAALLPEALARSRDLARLFLDQMFADSEVLRVTGYVLATLPNAANFCRRLGFEHEGTRRSACRIGGRATDVLVMGLVREYWANRGAAVDRTI